MPTPTENLPSLRFGKELIRRDENGFWNLTDMWRAAGANRHQKPYEWQRQPDVQRFVKAVEGQYHAEITAKKSAEEKAGNARLFPDAVRQTLGRTGATWAHWQVALAYARYLSPQFHMWANDTVRRVLDADPALVEEMFDRMSAQQQKHTAERMEGKVARRKFTDTLQAHGVSPKGYALCTEAIQAPILGMSTREAKAVRGVKRGSIRDAMSTPELVMTRMTEVATSDRIEVRDIHGDGPCAREAGRSARMVKAVYDQIVHGD
ncbi:hypothetical protein J2847_006748 [Azospirillum agricola]|uniref:KilA-N domain-containing protein n=1 Tax=Azospirillum agricola TaxID=1720247 RepID=UPI001AE262B4|nr:KilA-N domain-containing protein [Azospirillum agricola]MBP2233410.1 hypothetical protein [Azospirillum agricola]